MKIIPHLFGAILMASSSSAGPIITFDYDGTNESGGITVSTGSFEFSNPALTSVTLDDLAFFSLHQTTSSADGSAVAIFDFVKADLTSFAVSFDGGRVTSARFETDFNLQTSSPTNSQFKSQNFIALSATTAKTQYRDHLFPIPPPPTNNSAGPIAFANIPEPSAGALFLLGTILFCSGQNRLWQKRTSSGIKL